MQCFLNICLPSDVRPINKEVERGTDATVSCVVTGITQQLNSVVWKKGGTDVTTLSEDNSYVVSAGTYGSNSQTTTLTVKAAVNTADSTYTCVITSNEWLQTDKEISVALNVFGMKNKCYHHKQFFRIFTGDLRNAVIYISVDVDSHVN